LKAAASEFIVDELHLEAVAGTDNAVHH